MMDIIIVGVQAGGSMGAPSGVMYAALSPYMNLDVYQRLMDMMVGAGLLVAITRGVTLGGHVYTLTAQGEKWYAARCHD